MAATTVLSGCRGSVYRDVYQQKMASEIRVLEDQLYEADYHNQVLMDEVERLKARVAVPTAPRDRETDELQRRDSQGPPSRADEAPRGDDSRRSGPPENLPRPDALPTTPTLPARPIPDTGDRPEPPAVAIPPGAGELDFPDVDLGEPVPPGDPDEPDPPPGQIQLPDSVQKLYRHEPTPPVAIRVNTGLSGGHRFDDDDEKTGMYLAIEAIDHQGQVVDLSNFEIRGELSVALLDPQRDPADARLGQWTYDEEALRSMIRSDGATAAADRIDVYLPWDEKQPSGTHIIAHIRLSSEETQLRAEAELPIADAARMQWNPSVSRR